MTADPDPAPFPTARRGYHRAAVDETLAALRVELASTASARDEALENAHELSRQLETSRREVQAARATGAQSRTEVERLRTRVAELSTVPSTVEGMSERLQQMVLMAQDEVTDMRARATERARQLLALATAEAEEVRAQAVEESRDFEARRQAAEETLRTQQAESQARLDQLNAESDGQQARLDADFAERRARMEAEFATELNGRRKAVLDQLAAHEAGRREEVDRIVDAAEVQARTRLADATAEAERVRVETGKDIAARHRELDELRDLQHTVAEQLTSVRALLDWTLPRIGQVGELSEQGTGSAGAEERPSPVARGDKTHGTNDQAGART